MSELKPGYWKTRDGRRAFVAAERPFKSQYAADKWIGCVDGEEESKCWRDDGFFMDRTESGESDCDLVEYIGPTLPPDPGPGWRLLKKWPEPEPVLCGDEYMDVMTDHWEPSKNRTGRQAEHRWYRRRETPEPPQPPEGWELLPDGTYFRDTFQRLWRHADGNHSGWHAANAASFSGMKSGPIGEAGHLYYARRIEPEPVCPWCVKPVPNPERYVHCPHCYGSFSFNKPAVPSIEPEPFEGEVRWFPCERPRKDGPQYVCDTDGLWYVQRQYHDGEWRDVGVQQ